MILKLKEFFKSGFAKAKDIVWADRPNLGQQKVLVGFISLTMIGAVLKFKQPSLEVKVRFVDANSKKPSEKTKKEESLIKESNLSITKNHFGNNERSLNTSSQTTQIIERPLFDGLSVTLKGVIQNAVSSFDQSPTIEVLVTDLVREDGNFEIDASPVIRGKLTGFAAPNMQRRCFNLNFTELLSHDGRSYQVTGFALDPETKKLGVHAEYSSGLGSRLGGIAIDRGISLVDQIAMAKLMKQMTDDSITGQEVRRATIDANQQASMSIATEATRELREIQPELTLSAGTQITIKLKSASSKAGLR